MFVCFGTIFLLVKIAENIDICLSSLQTRLAGPIDLTGCPTASGTLCRNSQDCAVSLCRGVRKDPGKGSMMPDIYVFR